MRRPASSVVSRRSVSRTPSPALTRPPTIVSHWPGSVALLNARCCTHTPPSGVAPTRCTDWVAMPSARVAARSTRATTLPVLSATATSSSRHAAAGPRRRSVAAALASAASRGAPRAASTAQPQTVRRSGMPAAINLSAQAGSIEPISVADCHQPSGMRGSSGAASLRARSAASQAASAASACGSCAGYWAGSGGTAEESVGMGSRSGHWLGSRAARREARCRSGAGPAARASLLRCPGRRNDQSETSVQSAGPRAARPTPCARMPCAAAGGQAPAASKASSADSSSTGRPRSRALSSLLPASVPATT